MRNGLRERLWVWWMGLATLLTVTYFRVPDAWAPYMYSSFGITAGAVTLISIRIHRPVGRRPWQLLAAWLFVWGAADVWWNFAVDDGGVITNPRILYLVGYGCAAMFGIALSYRRRAIALGSLVDSAIVALSTGLLVWNLAFHPYIAPARLAGADNAAVFVAFLYPALDIFVFTLLAGGGIKTRKSLGSWWLFVAAVGILATGDVIFYWRQVSQYSLQLPIDATWIVSYLLLAAGALHPSMRELTSGHLTAQSSTRVGGKLVGAALLVPSTSLLLSRSVDTTATAIVGAVISVLVVVRLRDAGRARQAALRQAVTALDALEKKETSFRLLAEHSPDLIFRFRFVPSPSFEYVSSSSMQILGYTPEEHYNDPTLWDRTTHADHRADFLALVSAPGENPSTLRWIHKDGHEVWLEQVLTPIIEEGTVVAVEGRARDVTAQRLALDQLKALQARSDAILDSVGKGIIYTDAANRITFVNRHAAELLGWDRDELIGRNGHETLHHSRKDGSPYPAAQCPIAKASKDNVVFEAHDEVFWRKDGSHFPTEFVVTPLRGGSTSGAVIVFSDVTERELLEQRLRQTEKMEAVGQLAGGVAHDFNNLLSIVINYGTFVLDALEEGDPRRDDVEAIINAGERGARLTRQLLTFSRRDEAKPEYVSLNEIIGDVTKMLRRTIKESIDLELDLQRDLWLTYIDPGQVEQIVMNLALNANDAMPDGGRLTIRTSNLAGRENPRGRDEVLVEVIDTGEGMSGETRDRIFEPFFTTKQVGKGTGLGLATVYGVVERSGGSISCESEMDAGAKFRVLLPRADTSGTPANLEETATPRGRDQSIMVVEDEPVVLEIVMRLLRRAGFAPVGFSSPDEALNYVGEGTHPVDMLLTDIVMPGISGISLAARIDRPVVYMTGYPDRSLTESGYPLDGIVLRKPFSEEELLTAVESCLDGHAQEVIS